MSNILERCWNARIGNFEEIFSYSILSIQRNGTTSQKSPSGPGPLGAFMIFIYYLFVCVSVQSPGKDFIWIISWA